jgi:predicted DNA-binding protein with PD1-like motif
MRHHAFGSGHYVLRLDPGEDLVAVLRKVVEEQGIQAGTISGLGSVDAVTLGYLDPEANEYLKRQFEERMEVAALSGSISMDGERPHVHLHAVVSPREFIAYAGHVHEARVGAALEVFITAFPGRLRRVAVEGQPFPRMLLPDEPEPSPATAEPKPAAGAPAARPPGARPPAKTPRPPKDGAGGR